MKCDNTTFELVENAPNNSKFKLLFVQCSKCGSVGGVMDFYNIGTVTKEIETKVDNLTKNLSSVSSINNSLAIINQNIENLYKLVQLKLLNDKK